MMYPELRSGGEMNMSLFLSLIRVSNPPPPPPFPLPFYQSLTANVTVRRTFGHLAEILGKVVTFRNRMRLKFHSTVALP